MKVICPYCNEEIELDFESDMDVSLWNFYGESGDIELIPYCEKCGRDFLVLLKTKIEVIDLTAYKRG